MVLRRFSGLPVQGRRLVWTLLAAVLLGGCSGSSPSAPGPTTRAYRMGFSGIPPRADLDIAVQAIFMWSERADAAIMSYEAPWDSLLAGVPPETLLAREQKPLADYFHGRGFELWFYLDPANGLNRGGESDPLVRLGRSITEPAIQQLYRRYAVVADSMLRPDHFGVALETNLIRAASPPALYDAIRTVANATAADVRARNGTVRLGVSVQVDYAWGRLGGGPYRGVEQDFVDFPFIQALGLSSYPYFGGFAAPDSIPLDYYSRLLAGRNLPVAVTEGGWTSATLDSIVSTPELQRRYILRQAALLDAAPAIAVFQLTFTDLDPSVIPPGTILGLFAFLGLVDADLVPKPALAAWDAIFARPLRP